MRHLIRPLPLLLLLVAATACGGATSPPTSAAPGGAQAGTPTIRTPTAGAMGAGAPATRTVPGTVAPATATRGAVAASPSTPGAADLTFTDATRTTSTLPRRPERFACLTDICFDILAELGLEPVAIKDPQLALHPRYYGERAKGFAVIGGSFLEPNLEDIAKARPDLVIGLGGVHEGTRAGLGAIAPLYIMAPRTYNDSIAYLKEIGRLTGRGAQADAAAQRFLDRLAAYKARSPKDKTALVMNGSDVNFGIDTAGSLTGGMLAEVTRYPWPAPAPGQQGHESGGIPFSLEKVLEVDPDVLFVQTFGFGPTPPRPLSEQLAANPLWGELKAVKTKQVHEVSFFIWSTGRGTRALGLVLDEALPKLYPDVFPQALPKPMVMLTREEAGTARGAVRATGRGRLPLLVAVLALLIAGLGLYSLMIGTPRLSPAQLWGVLVEGGGTRLARVAVLRLRLPRLALGILAGAMLALAGVLLQDALRNPIAGPELLGVSAGAAAIVAAVVIFQLPVPFALVPWLALAGGLLSGGLVVLAARRLTDPIRLALIGAALTALLNALVTAIVSLGAQNEIGLFFLFLLGSLANRGWDQVRIVLPWAVVGIPLALLCARPLNLLGLGDEVAAGLGLPVLRTRLLLLLLAAGLTAAVVAVCGPVAFVALLAPHLARRLLGTADARLTLPLAALVGAALLLVADVAGRQAFAPRELPVGMWTTIVGAPLLLVLLRRQLGGGAR